MTPSKQGVVNHIGDNTIEVQDIVQMDNNAAVEVASVENPRPMHTELIPRLIGDLDHSIKSFHTLRTIYAVIVVILKTN